MSIPDLRPATSSEDEENSRRTRWPLTSLGWTAAASALVAVLLGTSFGWLEMLVVAAAVSGALIAAIPFVIGRSEFAVQVDLQSSRVTVGDAATGGITVRNIAGRSLLPARLELPLGSGVGRISVPRLAAGETHEDVFVVPTERRAVLAVGPVRSVRGDALGLLRREQSWTTPDRLFVHPRVVRLDIADAGLLRDLDGRATTDPASDDVSFHALRPYEPGDDRRQIHWRTSARTGALMVRQFEETRRAHVAIALSTSSDSYEDGDEFELAVSVFGSLAVSATAQGLQLSAFSGADRLATPGRRAILDQLSGIGTSGSGAGPVQTSRSLAVRASGASLIVVVTGSRDQPSDLHRSGLALPITARVAAVRTLPSAGSSTVRRLGDLTVLTVGSLDVLGRALRAVRT